MATTTFRDFAFEAEHHMKTASNPSAHETHSHSYVARFWFRNVDQDVIAAQLWELFKDLHGCNLNTKLPDIDTSDESLARYLFGKANHLRCFKVRVTNDGKRGAEYDL